MASKTKTRTALRNRQTTSASASPRIEVRPLTLHQERVCHLVADLIMNGGDDSDITNLLRATIGHGLRLQFSGFDFSGRIEQDLPDWRRRISREWPAKSESNPEYELPKNVSAMARANIRGELCGHFERFLAQARVHELYLLDNVLMDVDSCGSSPDADPSRSALAEAFMMALDSDDTYVKVPRDHVEAVERFLKTLDETPECEDVKPAEKAKLFVLSRTTDGPAGGAA